LVFFVSWLDGRFLLLFTGGGRFCAGPLFLEEGFCSGWLLFTLLPRGGYTLLKATAPTYGHVTLDPDEDGDKPPLSLNFLLFSMSLRLPLQIAYTPCPLVF